MNNNSQNLLTEQEQEDLARTVANDHLVDFAIAVDPTYEPAWFHDVIADALERAYKKVLKGERARIILEIPPRHGKTKLSTIDFPAWVLGKSPELPIIVTTYAQDLSSDFGQATRDLMNNQNYQAIFNVKLREDTKAKAKWLTDKDGGYTAVGVGGPITGKGFKIGIIDDPVKNREEADSPVVREAVWKWYRSTFLTREDGNGAIIVIMTRWHEDDLVGKILKENDPQWEVIRLPAIAEVQDDHRAPGEALWPERFPLETLLQRKKDLGPYDWSALYQQNPVDDEAREFKKDWLKYKSIEELAKLGTRNFVTIDPASALRDKSDFIGACINFVDTQNKWNLITYRFKVNPKELIDWMFKVQADYSIEEFGIEEGVYEQVIKPFLEEEMRKRNNFLKVTTLKHDQTAKVLRIRGLIPRYSSGSIYHITGMCNELEEEMTSFPKGAHDDVLDSVAYQNQIAQPPQTITYEQSKPLKKYYPELGI